MTEISESARDDLLDGIPEPEVDLSPWHEMLEHLAITVDAIIHEVRERLAAVADAIKVLSELAVTATRSAVGRVRKSMRTLYDQLMSAMAAARDHRDPRTYVQRRRRLLALLRVLQAFMLRFVRTLIAMAMHPARCSTYLFRLRELCLYYGNRSGPADHCCFLLTRQQPTCRGVSYALN